MEKFINDGCLELSMSEKRRIIRATEALPLLPEQFTTRDVMEKLQVDSRRARRMVRRWAKRGLIKMVGTQGRIKIWAKVAPTEAPAVPTTPQATPSPSVELSVEVPPAPSPEEEEEKEEEIFEELLSEEEI